MIDSPENSEVRHQEAQPPDAQPMSAELHRWWLSTRAVLASNEALVSDRQRRRWLIACSGGADSLALAEFARQLFRWQGPSSPKIESLRVAYVHHGRTSDPVLGAYREQARDVVKSYCAGHDIPFLELKGPAPEPVGLAVGGPQTGSPRAQAGLVVDPAPGAGGVELSAEEIELRSEAALREFRFRHLLSAAAQGNESVWLAHHLDDQIETRLFRLMRGTGLVGLRGMSPVSQQLFGSATVPVIRPFLSLTRSQIRETLSRLNVNFIEDPTNEDRRSVRNRIRTELAPLMESIRSGGWATLGRSIDTVIGECDTALRRSSAASHKAESGPLSISELRSCPVFAQRQILSDWARGQGLVLEVSQIEEVLKRVRSPRRSYEFTLAGNQWVVRERLLLRFDRRAATTLQG